MLICWNAEEVHGQRTVGNPWSNAWASEGFFSRFFPRASEGYPLADISTETTQIFPGRSKSDEISFFLLETKATTFFAKNVG